MDANVRSTGDAASGATERRRIATAYPIARWYLRPAAAALVAALAPLGIAPAWLTACGLVSAAAAAALLIAAPTAAPLAALLVLGAWFFDRADGLLARRTASATPLGAWLDGNVDELIDLGLHVAVAYAAARQGSVWAWGLLVAFLAGKYLLMYGLNFEQGLAARAAAAARPQPDRTAEAGWLSSLYHLPGNADVRVHLLAAAIFTGLLVEELALVAVYYNLRWIVRYGLVARRWKGAA